jgi:MoaA/NifB/PqqE/SkfB family radical SAM enzyme
MNCLDYVKSVDLPKIKGILGFSYVWNEKTNQETLNNLEEHREAYNPRYIRIVPNCQATELEQELNNEIMPDIVSQLGQNYFYQPKTFNKPDNCWWGYFKPFLLHDGFVYPCSSVVLNDSAERKFHEKFRWCRMEELERKYFLALSPFPTDNCTHCVFSEQNQLIQDIIYAGECKDFI